MLHIFKCLGSRTASLKIPSFIWNILVSSYIKFFNRGCMRSPVCCSKHALPDVKNHLHSATTGESSMQSAQNKKASWTNTAYSTWGNAIFSDHNYCVNSQSSFLHALATVVGVIWHVSKEFNGGKSVYCSCDSLTAERKLLTGYYFLKKCTISIWGQY